jgi:hypothetical protein
MSHQTRSPNRIKKAIQAEGDFKKVALDLEYLTEMSTSALRQVQNNMQSSWSSLIRIMTSLHGQPPTSLE